MRSQPLISLVLAVKNGLPHLQKAIDALRRQTYRNFELLVQDGASTDGTLEYLQSIRDLGSVQIVSQPDSGIGQAYNRGISRSRGDCLFLISSDEYLDDDALQKGVDWFSRFPSAAVVYGAIRLADAEDRIVRAFFPPAFELLGVIKNEVVVPTGAAFLNRESIGRDLYYDESLETCPDYDFWIRLGCRFGPDEIIRVPEPIVVARGDRASLSFRAESFDRFCKDKLFILNRYLSAREGEPETAELRKTGSGGILAWAAESVFDLEGASQAFLKWCREAAKVDPQSPRLLRLAKRSQAFEIDPSSGQFAVTPDTQPDVPGCETEHVEGILSLDAIRSLPHWADAAVHRDPNLRVVTGPAPWAFAAQIPLNVAGNLDEDRWYWVRLVLQVLSGQISVSLFADDEICNEHLILPSDRRVDVLVKINHRSANAIMIRNGSFPGPSLVEIFDVSAESCPKRSQP